MKIRKWCKCGALINHKPHVNINLKCRRVSKRSFACLIMSTSKLTQCCTRMPTVSYTLKPIRVTRVPWYSVIVAVLVTRIPRLTFGSIRHRFHSQPKRWITFLICRTRVCRIQAMVMRASLLMTWLNFRSISCVAVLAAVRFAQSPSTKAVLSKTAQKTLSCVKSKRFVIRRQTLPASSLTLVVQPPICIASTVKMRR